MAVVSPYLVAVCWTHLSRAFLAPPCSGGRGLLLTGGLVVSELSTEEVLLERAWSAGRLLVNSSICTTGERAIERERIVAIEKAQQEDRVWLTHKMKHHGLYCVIVQ